MKNKIKNVLTLVLMISILISIFLTNVSYASFADFDDATADKQAEEDLKEQQEEDKKNAGKSSNNYLKSLSIKGYKLSPEFDKQTIDYTIDKKINTNTIEITAEADDSRATVKGAGEVEIKPDQEKLRIEVIAENGMSRTYFIKFVKNSENNTENSNNEIIENKDIVQTMADERIENKSGIETKNVVLIIILVLIVALIIMVIKSTNKKSRKH